MKVLTHTFPPLPLQYAMDDHMDEQFGSVEISHYLFKILGGKEDQTFRCHFFLSNQ